MIEALVTEIGDPPTFLDPRQSAGSTFPGVDSGSAAFKRDDAEISMDAIVARANQILDAAIDQAQKDVGRSPRSSRARANFAHALMNRRRLDIAAREFELALELNPHNKSAATGLAQLHLAEGKLQDAQAGYTALFNENPSDPAPVLGLATAAMLSNEPAEAVRLLEQALELGSKSLSCKYHLGMNLLQLGRAEEAIAELREALSLNPRSALLRVGIAYAYARTGDRERAIQEFQSALHLDPGMIEATHGLAWVLVEDGATGHASSILEELLSQDPSDCNAREILACAYFRSHNYKKARTELHKVIVTISSSNEEAKTDKARLLSNLGTCQWRLGNHDEATKQFRHSISLEPESPVPYCNLGRLLLAQGQAEAAIPVLSQCEDRFPSDETGRLLLVGALNLTDRLDEAISRLTRWVRSQKAPERAWAVLGCLLTDRKQDPSAAVGILSEATERFPGHPGIVNNLAYALLMQGNEAAARTVLISLPMEDTERVPFEVRVVLHATWGLLHLREGDIQAAEQGYRQAEELALSQRDQGLAAAVRRKKHLEFARAFRRSGDIEASRREVRHGLNVAGEDPHRYRRELSALAMQLKSEQARKS